VTLYDDLAVKSKKIMERRVLRHLVAQSEEDDTSIAVLLRRLAISFRGVVHIRV